MGQTKPSKEAERLQLKKINEQVIVITGASNGIGLATAMMAAERGANVVLASRSANDLRDAVCQIRQKGGEAIYVPADVSRLEEVDHIAERALAEFGRIDSWINTAGVAVLGRLTEVPIEEKRHLFEVNFWGVVYGSRAAVKAMSKTGGAIINVNSALSDRAMPIIGMYGVTEEAVKAYTDALHAELVADKTPIAVSLASVCVSSEKIHASANEVLKCCEVMPVSPISKTSLYTTAVQNPGKSAAVAAGLGVAAFAAFKAIQHARKPDEITH